MKSVVVEASTVAKAIELAWQKAKNPEEFFIRILQEHSSGFLGFGAQKAKIVFFFKNSQKSDSLFPVVLKQKEYTSLFKNDKLKNPSQINVIDNELNKNISLNQNKNQKTGNKNNPQARILTSDTKQLNQSAQQKNMPQQKSQLNTVKTQVKIELPNKPVVKQEHIVKKEIIIKKTQEQPSQTIKNVSPKKKTTVQTPAPIKTKAQINNQNITDKVATDIVTSQLSTTNSAPRTIQKLKRRPLTGCDQGVSGITRSARNKPVDNKE